MGNRVMLTIPEDFLGQVDRVARREHRSRSELMREALRIYLRADEARRSGVASSAPEVAPRSPAAAPSGVLSSAHGRFVQETVGIQACVDQVDDVAEVLAGFEREDFG